MPVAGNQASRTAKKKTAMIARKKPGIAVKKKLKKPLISSTNERSRRPLKTPSGTPIASGDQRRGDRQEQRRRQHLADHAS